MVNRPVRRGIMTEANASPLTMQIILKSYTCRFLSETEFTLFKLVSKSGFLNFRLL